MRSFKVIAAVWVGSLMVGVVLGGCGGKSLKASGAADAGTDSPPDSGTSPGTVVVRFTAPPKKYCETTCGDPAHHITVHTVDNEPVMIDLPACSTMCSNSCSFVTCPAVGQCLQMGLAVNGALLRWDGRSYTTSTCGEGGNVFCYQPTSVAAGTYIARMCATPGTLSGGTDGISVCTPTGPLECVDVPFQLPAESVVTASLGGTPSCHAMVASAYDQTCATDADCVNEPEGDFCQGQSCTNCANATISVKAQTQYEADRAMNTLKTINCPCPADAPPVCDHGKCTRGHFGLP